MGKVSILIESNVWPSLLRTNIAMRRAGDSQICRRMKEPARKPSSECEIYRALCCCEIMASDRVPGERTAGIKAESKNCSPDPMLIRRIVEMIAKQQSVDPNRLHAAWVEKLTAVTKARKKLGRKHD